MNKRHRAHATQRKQQSVRLLSPETAAQRIVRVTETFYETEGTTALAEPVTNTQAKPSKFDSTYGNKAYGNGYGQPSGRPIPDIPPVSPTKPPMLDFGATGTSFFSGLLQNDEYNAEFFWRDAVLKYEQMRRNDPQIIAQEMMMTQPILAAKWSIEPASDDPKDIEIASFVETCLMEGMTYTSRSGVTVTQTFHDILKHALLLFAYGFTGFELCFKIEDGWVKWSRWLPLLSRTFWRWWVDEDNELVGVQQWSYRDYAYRFVDIPAGKLLVLSHRQEGQNYEGVSVLRTAFKPWWFKQNIEKILMVAIERTGVEVPVMHVGPTPSDSDIQAALTILQNIRANEYMGAVIPHDWTFEYPKLYANHAEAILPVIQYCDTMIARNVLCQFLDLGSTETGAYNLDASQKQTFLASLQATCEYLCARFQSPINQLVDYNFDDVAVYPKIVCSKLVAQDIVTLGTVLQQLGPNYIPATQDISDYIVDLIGLPKPPANAVQTTNPTDPNNPSRPQNDGQEQHATQQAQPVKSQPSGTGAGGKTGVDIESDTSDEGGDGGALSERVNTRLLNEALSAIYGWDATERGVRHLSNGYPRQSGGRFGFGPGGKGDGLGIGTRIGYGLGRAMYRAGDIKDSIKDNFRPAAAADRVVEKMENRRTAAGAFSHPQAAPGEVNYERGDETHSVVNSVMGRSMSDDDIRSLFGGATDPRDAIAVSAGKENPHAFAAELERADGSRQANFTAYRNEMGQLVVQVGYASNTEKTSASGEDLIHGMDAMQSLGVDKLITEAAGNYQGSMNGYYTWARLGFTGKIEDEDVLAAARAQFGRGIKNVQDVISQGRAGVNWWKVNGVGFRATFSFRRGSYSMKTLGRWKQAAARTGKGKG